MSTKKKMWYVLYNIGLILASPLIFLMLWAKKRCRRGFAQRLGLRRGGPGRGNCPVLWVHAVSLGEVVAVAPLVKALRARRPGYRIIVSTVTETGREAVEQKLAGLAEHRYAPLDFPWVVSRAVRDINPVAFLFVETELWPNLLRALGRRGVVAILVNGRLSSHSFRGYRIVRSFMKQVLQNVTLCLTQSQRDAQRFIALGAPPASVHITGNIKFDQPLPDQGGTTRSAIGLEDHEDLIVAGSTHPGEEEELLSCYEVLRREWPSLVLLIAPRHIERAESLEAVVRANGLPAIRRSRLGTTGGAAVPRGTPRVVILDTRGELAGLYRHAALAFVGGTLVPVGGHNLLEPAMWGTPVFFGPYTDHCAEMADLLLRAGGGARVRDGADLAEQMAARLRDRQALQRMGQSARAVVYENQGALARSLELIDKVLDTSCQTEGSDVSLIQNGEGWRWALRALALPYGLTVWARTALYDQGWLRQRRLPCRVVSVGNLTVGGTGKTPVVITIVEWLLGRGRRVAVLSRGYRRVNRSPQLLVSDGRAILADPAEAGDEPFLIARRCPRAVVAVGADRYRLGQWVLERFSIDCVVLDDGFQHRALHRDVDLLLVDASDPTGIRSLLPAGRLREPLSAAARATGLLLTRAEDPGAEEVLARLREAVGRHLQPVHVRFRVEAAVHVRTGAVQPVRSLAGRTAVACSGIANPASLRGILAGQGLKILDELVFPDHHDYRPADLEAIRARTTRCGAELIVTTEKDGVKLASLVRPEEPFWAVRLGTEIMQGRELLERLILGEEGIKG